MIDVHLVRAEPERIATNLARRGVPGEAVARLKKMDAAWRDATTELDALGARHNEANAAIARAPADQKKRLVERARQVAEELKAKQADLNEAASQREAAWRALPNLVADDVPDGGADQGEVVRVVPHRPPPTASARSYLELTGPALIDTKRAAKVSGSRFVYLKGELARLEFALVSYALDALTEAGFQSVVPPVLVRERAMRGMGYLDQAEEEIYRTQDELYLTGTSEQSIGPMHMDEVLPAAVLPLRYAGFSTCFRREAGSYGQDVKGMMRVHQFDKVEMFSFASPEQSAAEHEWLLAQQERLMQALELPYRVVNLAARELGAPAAKTYDLETWLPSEQQYRETHSASNTTDYQARRLNIRTSINGKKVHVHMLNATAFAIGRTLIAIIENYQQADGSMAVPQALKPYVPFERIAARS